MQPNLDFLNDMFGTILSNANVPKKEPEVVDKGW